MARRRRKGRGRRSKTFYMAAALPLAPFIGRAITPGAIGGGIAGYPKAFLYETIGYDMDAKKWDNSIWARELGLVIGGMIAHKVASRLGVNRHVKKLSMGYLGI